LETSKFANGETKVVIEESVRGQDCFIIQSPYKNINDHLIELLIIVHALKTSSAQRIVAVLPNYPYARADKKDKARKPITAKLIANMITTAGVDSVISMDLHANQIEGFFDIPMDNILAEPLIELWIRNHFVEEEYVLVSPDAGGVKRVTSLSDKLKCDFCIIHKERKKDNAVDKMVLVGEIKNKTAIILDDMADTCGTMVLASNKLLEFGAKKVYGIVTHGVLSEPALDRINESSLEKFIVTNTIPQRENMRKCPKLEEIDISMLVAEAIRRIHNGESMSSIHLPDLIH